MKARALSGVAPCVSDTALFARISAAWRPKESVWRTPQWRPEPGEGPAAQRPGAIHQGFLVREPERAALAHARPAAADDQHPDQRQRQAGVGQPTIEVELKLEGKAETSGTVLFSFELVYAGVFRIQNIPQENIQPVMMIECPRLLFPFAREIIATAVRNGGFPPLLIDPIDFVGALPPAHGAAAGTAATASRGKLTGSSCPGLTWASIDSRREMDCRIKPGNASD